MSQGSGPSKYTQDGVNVPVGDAFSALASRLIASTHNNCPYVRVEDLSRGLFRGPKPYSFIGLPSEKLCFEPAPDGIGTKVLPLDAMKLHRSAGFDLLAMASTDVTRWGGLPAVYSNVLAARSLGDSIDSPQFALYMNLVEGLVAAADEIGAVLLKGETAEVGVCVGSDNPNAVAPFNWEGVAHGIFLRDKMILGDAVRVGNIVVALRENGFRSNGISGVRGAFECRFGPDYYNNPDAREALAAACEPSKLYDRALNTAHGWYERDFRPLIDLHLIAHISGGGIGKFTELLAPTGLSARLDELYELPSIMRNCAEWRGMSDEEVYTTWNGGQGALVVVPRAQVDDFVVLAGSFNVEAKACGEIVQSATTKVEILSRYRGEELTFVHNPAA